ncbi:MAG: Fe-S-containing hydro-lyase [Anaerotignaceae bacterium]
MTINVTTPLTKEKSSALRAGDIIAITGTIYTARDAAHKRMLEDYQENGTFPFDMENAIIYYAGPSPAKPGEVIGSAGPTTSYRMDAYAPFLLDKGETGMIGKGARNAEVMDAMKRNGAVYFAATGGAAALISSHIKKAEVIAYDDLGAEAIHKLYVEDFPCVVVVDSLGNNLYESEKAKYRTL